MVVTSLPVELAIIMTSLPVPTHRVSYCTVDPYYDKVFCYISRNAETKGLECHAFLCSKKSKVFGRCRVLKLNTVLKFTLS